MKTLTALTVLTVGLQFGTSAHADRDGGGCSTGMLAGRWFFATGIGHQALANGPPAGDITALGTLNIRRNGDVSGTFDVTFEGAAFRAAVPYTGTLIVNDDCTAVLTFVTGAGTSRTDSIAILNRHQLWGMSRDPQNLWTYSVQRLSGPPGFRD